MKYLSDISCSNKNNTLIQSNFYKIPTVENINDKCIILDKKNNDEKYNRIDSGKHIYKTNIFLKSLTNIMENDEFKYIHSNYFDSWDNIKLFLTFSKVYESISRQQPTMSKYEKLHLLKTLIDTFKTRQLICKKITEFTQDKNLLK